MFPNELPPGLANEEPDLWAEDDIPTPAADEAENGDDTIVSDRDKPSRG